MTNAAFGYINQLGWPGASITDNGHATGFDPSNLLGPTQYPGWQSPHIGAGIVSLDAAHPVRFDCVALFGTNLTSAATIRIQVGSTAGANDIYDSGTISAGVVAGYGQTVNVLPGPIVGRYIRFILVDSANPDGFLSAGLCYIGSLWTPTRNFSYGQAAGWQDDSQAQVAKGGQKYFIQSPAYRKTTFKLENLTETDLWANAAEIDRMCGVQNNVLFIPDPAGSHINYQSVFGTMKQSDQQVRTSLGRYSKSYEIDERL
jgi:hypothetical protein